MLFQKEPSFFPNQEQQEYTLQDMQTYTEKGNIMKHEVSDLLNRQIGWLRR